MVTNSKIYKSKPIGISMAQLLENTQGTQLENEVQELPYRVDLLIMDFGGTVIDFYGPPEKRLRLRKNVRLVLNHYGSQAIPIVISSDIEEGQVQEGVEEVKLQSFFDDIYGRSHMLDSTTKDIARICRERGVAPERTLVIGDRPDIDGESARKAGAMYLWVPAPRVRNDPFTYSKFFHIN